MCSVERLARCRWARSRTALTHRVCGWWFMLRCCCCSCCWTVSGYVLSRLSPWFPFCLFHAHPYLPLLVHSLCLCLPIYACMHPCRAITLPARSVSPRKPQLQTPSSSPLSISLCIEFSLHDSLETEPRFSTSRGVVLYLCPLPFYRSTPLLCSSHQYRTESSKSFVS